MDGVSVGDVVFPFHPRFLPGAAQFPGRCEA